MKRNGWRLLTVGTVAAMVAAASADVLAVSTASADSAHGSHSTCRLSQASGRRIKHVVYVVWDNTHLLRDNPNVPSDLEQMPHLMNFLKDNGSLLTNEHTPLIAHTADDIVTSLTGVYPDQHGLNVANSYGYFNTDGSISFPSAFTYWTDPVQTSRTPNPPFNLITQQGKNAPAPWVPFTRAGCNVAAVASGDIALENTGTGPSGDITRIFGNGSPLWIEAQKENAADSTTAPGLASANFEGLVIHCAANSSLCHNGEPDTLPDEPGGYNGFKGLFGALQVDPALTGKPVTTSGGLMRAPALTALSGQPILDGNGNAGFPGFDSMQPTNSLAIVASMLERNVPVAFAYLTDAHDDQVSGNAFGPGEAGYVKQLHDYDHAFAQFFARLAKDGINKSNTLFLFTSDEGDHFVGAKPLNAGCDGVTVACTYDPSKIGEIDANLPDLLRAETGNTTPFAIHSDSAPAFYINGNPGANDPTTRQLERDTAFLNAFDPIINRTVYLTNYLAGPTELKLLHMQTGDPRRDPSFVQFANPNYFLNDFNCAPGGSPPGCVSQFSGDAYSHGDVGTDINRTWLGLVGPGVKNLGETGAIWSSHTDDRPTVLALLGLHDDYVHQGRVLTEVLDGSLISREERDRAVRRMARVYTQLESPVGQFGLDTLRASTGALASNDPGDATYNQCDATLSQLGNRRDTVAGQMQALLNGAEFDHQNINPTQAQALTAAGEKILQQALSTAEFCTT